MGSRAIVRCIGRDELVRDQAASFFSDLDRVEAEDPTRTRLRLDTSPSGIETRLVLESLIRRTPVPVSNTDLTVGHEMLADDLPFQREPFRLATTQLQPRLLVADAVGLGKTIEVGMLLAELQRRGRANRVLAVVPRHILDQVQHELWCRCAFPLVRLDSEGIQRVRQRIPAGRNPFTYFNRVIVSMHAITSHFALPLLIKTPGGLVVEVNDGTAEYNDINYRVSFFYDLAKAAVLRMAFALGHELQPYGATAVSLTPGWLRSEAMLEAFGVTESNWHEATSRVPHFAISESPAFVGRAVAALAQDPDVARWNGQSLSSGQLAKIYGFTDLDGSQPDAWRYVPEVQDAGKTADVTGYR